MLISTDNQFGIMEQLLPGAVKWSSEGHLTDLSHSRWLLLRLSTQGEA